MLNPLLFVQPVRVIKMAGANLYKKSGSLIKAFWKNAVLASG